MNLNSLSETQVEMKYDTPKQSSYGEAAKWILRLLARSGTAQNGVFTEAQLLDLREMEPKSKKKASAPGRNALASALWLQRKMVKTLSESMDEINSHGKRLWWSRWIAIED
ncbi:hypothetical protein ACFX13_021113 [Malus domestica]